MNNLTYWLTTLLSKYKANPTKHLYEEGAVEGKLESLTAATVNIKMPAVYDLSKWETVTNWYTLDPRPALVILRATYGASYVDPTYKTYLTNAYAAGYPVWGYHFLLYTQNWMTQADLFIKTVKAAGIPPKFRPVLDVEGYLPSGMSQATANGMIENWLGRVESALGITCYIYSSRNYLSQLYTTTPPLWLRNTARMKWIAGYPSDPNSYTTMPDRYLPVGIDKSAIALWQYSANGIVRGITGGVDLNNVENAYA